MSGEGSEVGGFVADEPPRPRVVHLLPATPDAPDTLVGEPMARLEVEEDRPRSRWPVAWFAFSAVFALTGATALILPQVAPVFGGGNRGAAVAPAGSPSARLGAVACAVDSHDRDFCRRFAKDVLRRAPVSADVRRQLEPATGAVEDVVRGLRPAPGQQPADALRTALAGHPGSVVRVARPDDPAPVGSVLFVVPLGDDCFLGHMVGPLGAETSMLVGRLPDGTCLSG